MATIDRMRDDRWKISVSVDGVNLPDSFDTFAGGDTDATETKYRPGGMDPEVSLGGAVSVANIVVTRNYALGRDDVWMPTLRNAAGVKPASVTLFPLDADRNVHGSGETFTGILQRVRGPQADSNSQNAAMIELEIAPGATVA